jgi:hypothetical protein
MTKETDAASINARSGSQRRHDSLDVASQLGHPCRSPRPARLANAPLVVGQHRDAGGDELVPKRIEIPAVAAVRRSRTTD